MNYDFKNMSYEEYEEMEIQRYVDAKMAQVRKELREIDDYYDRRLALALKRLDEKEKSSNKR